LALDPLPGSLYETAGIADIISADVRVDVRDASATSAAIAAIAPDVVFHLAAQPLVLESYREPRQTFETNVMGTLNVLEAVANTASVRALVVVTTDKVYRNVNQVEGYAEADPLGGDDPYSASKAMADLLVQSWVKSFPGVATAVARAGNVIGGGDVSMNRLVPDLLRSFAKRESAALRYPDAVRPWQHVLDCLNGYLMLADALLAGSGFGEWNFGPGPASFVSVRGLADLAAAQWGGEASWHSEGGEHLHEANLLALDAAKAHRELNWVNHLDFSDSVRWTVEWQRAVSSGQSPLDVSLSQIREFEALQ
jgi:CDP-glucose 4,6-dehydratase